LIIYPDSNDDNNKNGDLNRLSPTYAIHKNDDGRDDGRDDDDDDVIFKGLIKALILHSANTGAVKKDDTDIIAAGDNTDTSLLILFSLIISHGFL